MKRTLSILLTLVIMLSIANIATFTEVSAAGYVEEFIFDSWFEIPAQWYGADTIYCHIWELGEGGKDLTEWQSDEEIMHTGSGLAYFPSTCIDKLERGKYYGIIFSTDTGEQTYPAIFGLACNGSYFYTDGTYAVSDTVDTPSLVGKWTYDDFTEYEEEYGFLDGYKEVDPDTFVPDNSGAEELWNENIPEGTYAYGDVNLSGSVTIKDATEVQKQLVLLDGMDINLKAELLMDVYLNGQYNIRIATEIQKYCAKLPVSSKVGCPAVSKVYILRPEEWDYEETVYCQFSDEYRSESGTASAVEDESSSDMLYFYIPVYAPKITIFCGESRTPEMPLDLKENSTDGVYNYIAWPNLLNPEDGLMYFDWRDKR